VDEWRLKNISPRYSGAAVRRFAFLFPKEASGSADKVFARRGLFDAGLRQRGPGLAWLAGKK
jgi:hypothetical protein